MAARDTRVRGTGRLLALVYATGGTRTAFAHVSYVPIVLVALPFGVGGGVFVALVATVLCGPAMPLDVAAGEPQELMNWLARGGFFVTIGGVSGSTIQALRRSFEADLASQLRDEVDHATSGDDFEWEQIAQATLYGMDPYRSAMVGEAPFDVADAHSADTAH